LPLVAGSEWRKTGATVLAEENTSLFDYVHDNNFCLVVSLLIVFFNGMLVINNFIFFKEPCYSLAAVNLYTECLVVRVR